MNNIYKDFLIGNTPLVRLKQIEERYSLKAKLYAKLEWYNLTGSIKDRPSLQILLDAKKNGLTSGSKVIEATSGNMGISLSAICQKLGYKAVIVMPENMSDERKAIIKAYGAELVLTKKELGMKGAVDKAEEIFKSEKEAFMPMQFSNPSNPLSHYLTTAPEIYEELDGDVSAFVAGVGTGGTLSGIAKYLKEKNNAIKIYGVEPQNSPMLSKGVCAPHKIQGIGANFVPENYQKSFVDEIILVSDEDAFEYSRQLSKLECMLVGISSGANIFGAISVCQKEEFKGKNVVTVLPDNGIKYLSTGLYK
ncbi:MAG: cysteine synthase A [Clostridia bacterium]|nr:cysteine synthase A [Clostridia bacterium]